ncbi:MAG: hypothetical protein ABJM06_12340 [Gilvibacter sp.]
METKTRFEVLKRALASDIKWIRVGFVVLLFAFVGIAFFGVTIPFYDSSARDVKGALVERDSIVKDAIINMPFTGKEAEQIIDQYHISRKTKDSYMMFAFHYTVYNYAFSIFFTIFSVITGILGFLLVKKGWDNTRNYYLRAAFLVSFFFSTLFGLFPRVMNNEENVKNNLSQYHLYNGYQMDLYNLAKDNKGYFERNTKGSLDSLNREIIAVSKSIKDNGTLYFDIKIDQVPTDIKPFEEK